MDDAPVPDEPTSVGRFNEAADRYYQVHPNVEHFSRKPFHNIEESGSILMRLGIIMQNLHVGAAHTVLDFGAGSCWLALILNKLGIATVSVDVSATALAMGRALFEKDPFTNRNVDARFLVFDGYRIDLPDRSVDRVICFDSFHHLPNPATVLGELARVLVDGGIAAFAEPGEQHSEAVQSRHEAAQFGVLENDVNLRDLWPDASAAGFTDIKIAAVVDAQSMLLDLDSFLAYREWANESFPHQSNRYWLRGGQVFFLHKGAFALDTAGPGRLVADLRWSSPLAPGARPGMRLPFAVEARNTSETLWKARRNPRGGFVQLGVHLFEVDADGGETIRDHDFLRVPLPRDVRPGDSAILSGVIVAPEPAGSYLLTFDLVDEGVKWFSQDGSRELRSPLEVR
jgi:SAM-dependent methyltransferase